MTLFSVSQDFMPDFSLQIDAGTVIFSIFIEHVLPAMYPGWVPVIVYVYCLEDLYMNNLCYYYYYNSGTLFLII